MQPAEGRCDCTPIGRFRWHPWEVWGKPHRPLLVQQKSSAVESAQRFRNLRQVRSEKIQQLMLPGQALEIHRRMLHVQDHWAVTLQQKDIVGITTGKRLD